jgi:hypothetical protein
MVGLALAVTLTVSCDVQLSPDPPSPKSKPGSTSPAKPKPKTTKPKANPNPPPGVKHDIPDDSEANADYDKKPNWESQVRSNCRKAGYAEDCLILTYNFKKLEDGKLTPISDPETGYEGYKSCKVTKVIPPTGDSKKIAPNTKVTVFVVCIPETETSPSN